MRYFSNKNGYSLIEVVTAIFVSGLLIAPIIMVTISYSNGANMQMKANNAADDVNLEMFKIVQDVRKGSPAPTSNAPRMIVTEEDEGLVSITIEGRTEYVRLPAEEDYGFDDEEGDEDA